MSVADISSWKGARHGTSSSSSSLSSSAGFTHVIPGAQPSSPPVQIVVLPNPTQSPVISSRTSRRTSGQLSGNNVLTNHNNSNHPNNISRSHSPSERLYTPQHVAPTTVALQKDSGLSSMKNGLPMLAPTNAPPINTIAPFNNLSYNMNLALDPTLPGELKALFGAISSDHDSHNNNNNNGSNFTAVPSLASTLTTDSFTTRHPATTSQQIPTYAFDEYHRYKRPFRWFLIIVLFFLLSVGIYVYSFLKTGLPVLNTTNSYFIAVGWCFHLLTGILFLLLGISLLIKKLPFYSSFLMILHVLILFTVIVGTLIFTSRLNSSQLTSWDLQATSLTTPLNVTIAVFDSTTNTTSYQTGPGPKDGTYVYVVVVQALILFCLLYFCYVLFLLSTLTKRRKVILDQQADLVRGTGILQLRSLLQDIEFFHQHLMPLSERLYNVRVSKILAEQEREKLRQKLVDASSIPATPANYAQGNNNNAHTPAPQTNGVSSLSTRRRTNTAGATTNSLYSPQPQASPLPYSTPISANNLILPQAPPTASTPNQTNQAFPPHPFTPASYKEEEVEMQHL